MFTMELRCTNCGAPLPKPSPGQKYIRCIYCGHVQRVIDARQYLDKLLGEVYSWISSIIPEPQQRVETIDRLARYRIFVDTIKPRVETLLIEYRPLLKAALSEPLFVVPEWWHSAHKKVELDDVRKTFIDLARVESVEGFAVDPQSQSFIKKAIGTIGSYAYIQNLHYLASEESETELLLNNVSAAKRYALLLEDKPLLERLESIKVAYLSVIKAFNGEPDFMDYIAEAERKLAILSSQRIGGKTAMIGPGLHLEHRRIKALKHLFSAINSYTAQTNTGIQEIMAKIEAYFEEVNRLSSLILRGYLSPDEDLEEMLSRLSDILFSKIGSGKLYIVGSKGEWLIPLWIADFRYVFSTGFLFTEKSRVVSAKIIVPAIPADPQVSDVFKGAPNYGFLDWLLGQEKTLTSNTPSMIYRVARQETPRLSDKIIPPMITSKAATDLLEAYLRSKSERLIQAQVNVQQLIYIRCHGNTQGTLTPPPIISQAIRRFNIDNKTASIIAI